MHAQDYSHTKLRTGFTTGACATAATQAALHVLFAQDKPKVSRITLPRGEEVEFSVERYQAPSGREWASACIIKDAGDDPDVTHGAQIWVRVQRGCKGQGVVFRAGDGVGTVTLAGLPLAIGEPAINPVPRDMIKQIVTNLAKQYKQSCDIVVEISIPHGERMAQKTWNPRLGIKGGLSILGTTGIVQPYSCAAWIDAIKKGIDVARANGYQHIAGATGHMSEKAVQHYYQLPDLALIDMGDFVGGMLRYLVRHPVKKITIAGGVGKITKLAQGALDLHSKRSQVNLSKVAQSVCRLGVEQQNVDYIEAAPSMAAAVATLPHHHKILLYHTIIKGACETVRKITDNHRHSMEISVLLADRQGCVLASSDEMHV